MDRKLVLCMTSLREEAAAARMGAPSSDLNSLINDVSDLCKQAVSEEDLSFAIAITFDKENGIFSVLELLLTVKERTVIKARESCFTFCAEFIEQIGTRALPHVAFIKEKCLYIFRRDESKSVQAAALNPLRSILEANITRKNSSYFNMDWTLGEMLLQEYRKAKTSGTLRSNILILLGYLIEYFPATVNEDNVGFLLKLCLDTLEEQLRQTNRDPVFVLVAGVIKCLDSLLTWYDNSLPAGGSVENSRRLYTFLQQIVCYREDIKRYEAVKAGLRLLSRHAGLFGVRLVQDSKEILDWLQTYCTHANAPLRDAGLSAFNQFISQVSNYLIDVDSRVQNVHVTYKHLMTTFLGILDAQNVDKMLLALAVRGVGKLSPAIVKFSGRETLLQVFHRLIPFGGSTSKADDDQKYLLGHFDTLIGAFADIVVQLESVEDFMVAFIAEVTGNIFYQFPQLFPKQKEVTYITLSKLFESLYLKGTIFSFFLNNIVWSSLERTMESTEVSGETGLPLWPHYVELWSHLLDVSAPRTGEVLVGNEGVGQSPEYCSEADGKEHNLDLRQFQEFIFDTIVRCVMKSLMELNLKYKVRANDKQVPASLSLQDEAESAAVEPETEQDMIEPLNSVDMHKYLNLVEFTQGLISERYADLFLKWVYPFSSCIMDLSSRYPLISGHYKLLTVAIRNAESKGYFLTSDTTLVSRGGSKGMAVQEEWKFFFSGNKSVHNVPRLAFKQRESCTLLFRRYLQEVLVASRRYKLELLASCLRLCLSAPPGLIDIGSLVMPLQTALKIGLRYPPLASVAMDALECWHELYPQELNFMLPDIVRFLSDYLGEVESTELADSAIGESSEPSSSFGDVGTTGSLSRSQLARLRQIRAKANQPGPFELSQLRVQKFLGRIGWFNHFLVPEVDLLQVGGTGGLAWDTVDRIQFTFPFRDEKLDVWLDSLLPRVVELAMSSSDRRTKVIANELLHALCLVMLGNTAKGPLRKNEISRSVQLTKIYERLFPAILRLAVDVELVTRQLFDGFVKQLIHWYTSNLQRENPETIALLDAILDGLVDADNGSLREFCAACFAEFFSWSVRHAPPETNNFVNLKSMLRRLYNRMDHPNSYKRLGASMAAYRIYPVLRGTPSIVDRYIFEMIFFSLKSLRLAESDNHQIGTIKQANKTLDVYLKLVERNIGALQRTRKDRPMFLTLDNFLDWLLQQTLQLQENYHLRCMSALSLICSSLPVGSLAGWFHSRSGPKSTMYDVIGDNDLNLHIQASENIERSEDGARHQLQGYICSLDWLEWALKEGLITTEELQMNTKSGLLVEAILQSCSHWCAITPGQRDSYQKLKCRAIFCVLKFIKQIVDIEVEKKRKGASKEIFNTGVFERLIPVHDPKFYEIVCLSLLCPRDLGFVITDANDAEGLANLASSVIQLLTVNIAGFKIRLTRQLQKLLNESKLNYDLSVMNLSLGEDGTIGAIGLEDARSLLKGYQQLHLSGLLLPVLGKEEGKKMGENLMRSTFEIGRECPPTLESIASEMLSFSIALGMTVQQLVGFCLDEKIIKQSSNARTATAGGIFYLNFRKVIVRQVQLSFKDCQATLLHAAVKNPIARLLLNAVLDDYIKSCGDGDNSSKGNFLEELLLDLKFLQPCCTSDAGLADKQFFLDILRKVFILDTDSNVLMQHHSAFQFIGEIYFVFLSGSHSLEHTSTSSSSQDANFYLKSYSLVLLPYFFKPPFNGDFQSRLLCSLTKLVSDHLLVREVDLPPKSSRRSSYLQMLSRLLEAVALSRNLLLLEIIFPLLLHPVKFIGKKLLDTLEQFAETIGESRIDAFDFCIQFLDDGQKMPRLKRAVIERVFLPLVTAAPVDFVATWYATRIEKFVEILGQQPSDADQEKEQGGLLVKICHYILVEHLFLRVEAPLIKVKITPAVPNATLMKLTMSDSRAKNDPLVIFPDNSALWRDLHIAAYNCLAAIALRTQEQEKVYSILFKEGAMGMIWQHLINTVKIYNSLPVESNQSYMAYQSVKEMRADQKTRILSQGNVSGSLSSLSSQYFVGSVLSQEPALIKSFVNSSRVSEASGYTGVSLDIGDASVGAETSDRESGASEEMVDQLPLDQDDFDLHPCMSVILILIESLHSRFGIGHQDMPEWMKGLHSSLHNAATHVNIRLFLSKVVIKAWKVFSPYSQVWFLPIVQTILLDPVNSGGRSFHYMLRDICITVLRWKFVKPPDAGIASTFVNYLMTVAAHESSQVLRANVDIIRLFLDSWKDDLNLDKGIILNYICAGGKVPSSSDRSVRMQRIIGLQLLGAMVVSGLPMYDPERDQFLEKDLYLALLQNLGFRAKEVYEASGELLGLALKQRHQAAGDFATARGEDTLEGPLKQSLLNFVKENNLDYFLNILNKITLRYPKYVEGFASILLDMLPKLHGVFKTIALDIFLRCPTCVPSLMMVPIWNKLFTHRDEAAQLKSLQLLMELIRNAPDERINEKVLPVLCEAFPMHENGDCRQQFYHILVCLYEREGGNCDTLLRRSLLVGLTDNADAVRHSLQGFWHSQLSQDLRDRLSQMINQMFDPKVEEYWAQFTNILLFKLSEGSSDYKRPIFNAPLADCEFHEQTINTSWLGSSLPMTPLFSESQNMPQITQGTRSQLTLPFQAESVNVPRDVGVIRATMVPTQTQATFESSTLTSQDSALFAMGRKFTTEKSVTSSEETVPRRRILHENAARFQIVRSVLNANRRREARALQQATDRANKVHMMRHYRIGELPDIEIKYEDILAPMAALAEKDATFARLLLTLICRAVYSQRPRRLQIDKAQDIKARMTMGIERALETTSNGTSFIGCLGALCLEDPEIWIQPKLVGTASRKSNNFHTGILVLERVILNERLKETLPVDNSSKRQKGADGKVSQEKQDLSEAWLELAHLYKIVGEDHVVLSLYRKNLTRMPVTHKALEAQLGGDSSRGLILYDQALEGMSEHLDGNHGQASQIEQDIWYNQRLMCLVDLNRWEQIVADALVQVEDEDTSEPNLQRLWDPNVREPYLSLFLRGAVKVPAYRSLAADFIQNSLGEPSKREVLMKEYGLQLAIVAVVNDQLDQARFYLSHAYRIFRKQWSALHPLAVLARHHQVQKLQKIVELDEYIELVIDRNLSKLPSKIYEWRHRWPSSRDDSIEAWDDIVQNRLVFFHKFQSLINKQFESAADDVNRSFACKLDEERACSFSQAASGLTKHGAFTVAQKYMEEYISLRQGCGEKDKLDFGSIKRLVKLRCLQANHVKLVQASEAIDMLQQVLGYVKFSAEKPVAEQSPVVMIDFKLLGASVSFQLASVYLDDLTNTGPNQSNIRDCLSLLGSAYLAYSEVCSSQLVASGPTANTKTPRQLAKIFLKFSQFCDELLKSTKSMELSSGTRDAIIRGHSATGLPPASVYPTIIVKHVMKAVALDTSTQGQHGVARLLSLIGQHPETHAEFLNLVRHVPNWIFLPWIPQMLAVMDQEEGRLFVGILEEMARLYPQALYFAFHVSEGSFGPTGQERTRRLAEFLKNVYFQSFVRALEDLTFPEQRLRDGLSQMKNCLIASDVRKAKAVFDDLTEDCLDVDAMCKPSRQAGDYNCKFACNWSKQVRKAFGENGNQLLHMDEKIFSVVVKDLISNLQKAIQELQSGVISLEKLSKWLATFDQSTCILTCQKSSSETVSWGTGATGFNTEGNIEIPGQYRGFYEPSHLLHVKLVGFDQTLISLSSKQRPKVLTMRGSDEKEYKFVVKGGEDLRLDQRIEQLFDVMNGILKRNSGASRRGLSVRTYAVIPVSRSCGLLQFVENTCVLEDVVKDGLVCRQEGKGAPTAFLQKLRSEHTDWVMKKGGPSQMPYDCFTNLYARVGFHEVSQVFTKFQSQLPWDAFRAGVSRWATSAESYLALRSQFAKSLSVVSICGYIAGVGDRHLGNTLVDIRSGSLVPIDFGYSFGTGVILLPVPELIPFRLTNQLTNFLLPLDALGLLRTDMVHTLSALHASKEVISAVMDIFVKEPLVEWKNEAIKTNSFREKRNEPHDMGSRRGAAEADHEQQFVELKVENAQRKLQLWNPAVITIAELQSSVHASKPYLPALEAIVRGSPDRNVRARIHGNQCGSIGEQVDCLIDQATDPNLLGRIWSGWQAWV